MNKKTTTFITDDRIRTRLREFLATAPEVPAAVYRLQLNPAFPLARAAEIVGYLDALGIQGVYSSPLFQATPGSPHGYDVTDAQTINPEIGGEESFRIFCAALQAAGMKHMMDVVPNHMGIGGNLNKLWIDVLENGPSSPFAHYFDIDWDPEKKELKDKVLIPLLGDHYGRVLENQEIQLQFDDRRGEFFIRYWDHFLPIAPKTYPLILEYGIEELKKELGETDKGLNEFLSILTGLANLPPRNEKNIDRIHERIREKEVAKERLARLLKNKKEIREFVHARVALFNGRKGDRRSFDLLDELLGEQAYRMAFWRVAAEEINYRRFFDINSLAAIRVESEDVFRFQHQMIFKLLREHKVTGLRIDHPDGLYDPPQYFRKLQHQFLYEWALREFSSDPDNAFSRSEDEELRQRVSKILDEAEFRQVKPLHMVVEKILDRKEFLPENWNVHGTVGYDFLNLLSGLYVDRDREPALTKAYEDFTGLKINFEQLTYEKKKFFALVHMSSEINTLALRLDRISEKDRRFRDFTRNNLAVAIREVIACFPVYRTYIAPDILEVSERDQKYIHIAIEKAKRKTPALPHALYDFLRDILLLKLAPELSLEEERLYRDFILRFQQLTGPVMAKGLEDTAFYIYNRLISLNEVGGDPMHYGTSAGEFHKQNMDRRSLWPKSLITGSTHDTKRSEDVRLRIHVLSEMGEAWAGELAKWATVNDKYKTAEGDEKFPEPNTEYFIYQTLLGVWPFEEPDEISRPAFYERIWNVVLKSIREAKGATNWANPNAAYEEAVRKFVYAILTPSPENYFLDLFRVFQDRIAECGCWNALSAAVLKTASPGILDIYQGTELWDFSLVDPDNRRPVDYQIRQKALKAVADAAAKEPRQLEAVQRLVESKTDGRIKLYLLACGLRLRREMPQLFIGGDYLPLRVSGPRERHLVAFMRKADGQFVIAAGARFFYQLQNESGHLDPFDSRLWEDTFLMLPKEFHQKKLKDALTGRTLVPGTFEDQPALKLKDVLGPLPGALIAASEES